MLLQVRRVGMQFPGVRALQDVDFDVAHGEVHALVGENGAGKSTLAKIIAGELVAQRGQVLLDGQARAFASPREALAAGVGLIPQELQIVDSLTVAENILLGHEPHGALGWVDATSLAARARASLDAIGGGARIDVGALASQLPAGDRQMVAIARALSLQARLLIMDEPTASLGDDEAARLAEVIRRVVAAGTAVVYVSHKLQEVLQLADRVTVLRDGQRVATLQADGLNERQLVRLMVGRDIVRAPLPAVGADAATLLEVDGLSLADPARPGGFRFRDVSLSVRAGEILGITGLVGAGRTDLLLTLAGAATGDVAGAVRLRGVEVSLRGPAAAREQGVVLLPEERKADAVFPGLSVAANMTMAALPRVCRLGWIDRGEERRQAQDLAAQTGVRAATLTAPMATLSGGNQQKALLARCLFAAPEVLLLDEPTRGIDLAAKQDIYAKLRDLASRGFAILLCSSELSEVLTQSHRLVVMREGRVVATLRSDEADEESVMAAATGAGGTADRGAFTGGGGGAPPPRRIVARLRGHAGLLGLAMVLALAIVFSPLRNGLPIFLDPGNLADVLRQVSEKGILAVGMTAVVITGGIDLSVGSLLAFGATLSALLLMQGYGLASTALLVLAACAAWGAFNGLLVARWRLPAFIVTLATMSAARGAARFMSGGTAIPLGFGEGGATDAVRALASPLLPYVPAPALIFVLSALAMHLLLARTRTGRYLYAIGDNESAARLSGVRVAWNKTTVYVISAALAGVAGLVHCAQLQQGNPNDGIAYELDAIAAVVVGGTALRGGSGTVGGTLTGILIIGIINNILGLNNVDANLQLILKGVIILSAVWLQQRHAPR